MKRSTIPSVLFAVLLVTSLGTIGVGGAQSDSTISDSVEDGWKTTTAQGNIVNTSGGYEVGKTSDSYQTSNILSKTAESGRLDVNSNSIVDSDLGAEKHGSGSVQTVDYSGTMDRTAVTVHNGEPMHLITRYDSADLVYDESGDEIASIGTGTGDNDAGGLVDVSGTRLGDLMVGYWGSSSDIALISEGSTPEVQYVNLGLGTEELGLAKSPHGNNRFFIMDSTASDYDSGTTNILEVKITGSYSSPSNIEAEIIRDYDVGTLYNHRGLGYREGPNTFVTYDEDGEEYVEFDQSGNVVDTTGIFEAGGLGAATVEGDEYHVVYPASGASWNTIRTYSAYDKTQSSTAEWTSDLIELDQSHGEITGSVDVTGDVYDSYEFQVQTRNGSGSWQTHDSATLSSYQDSNTLSFDTELNGSGEIELRVQFRPNGEVRLKDNGNGPRVTDISFDHEYYDSAESVRVHDQFEPDQGFDFSEARTLDELVVEGTNATGASIDAEFVNQQEEVVCTIADVVNSRVDLGSTCDIDLSQYKNQQLFLDFWFTSEGGTTDSLESWELTYEERTKNVEITDWEVTGGYDSETPRDIENTQFRSAIESTDQFRITGIEGDDVTSEVDDARWYVDGNEVAHYEDVPVDEIPPLEQTWNESGTHEVTAEVFHGGHGTDTQSWEVSVYDILIGGQDSFSESPGGTIHVTQQFQVFEIDDAVIDYELEYDEDVLRKISGPTNGSVDSGMSRTWEFQVDTSDYNGEPITITATHDDVEVTKKIAVSTAESSGGLPTLGDDIFDTVLSNTWLEYLGGDVLDIGQTTYIHAQTILTGGLLSVLWLHHFRTISLPVGDWTLRQLQTRTKVGLSIIGGTIGVGFVLPWIGLISVLTGLGWYFWDPAAARFREVTSPI